MFTTGAIFLARLLGLVYVIPFSAMVGTDNLAFYGYAYVIYAYVLQISTAGLPFATATLVAKYNSENNYRSSRRLFRTNMSLMLMIGILITFVLVMLAPAIAELVSPNTQDIILSNNAFAHLINEPDPMFLMHSFIDEQGTMLLVYPSQFAQLVTNQMENIAFVTSVKNVLMIISTAILIVPLQSVIRGYFQGFKFIEISSKSQLIEQLVRVSFLLVSTFVIVVLLKIDPLYAVYFAVFDATISALVSTGYLRKKYKQQKPYFDECIAQSNRKVYSLKFMYKELVVLAVPYIAVVSLGSLAPIIDSVFFASGLQAYGYTSSMIKEAYGIFTVQVTKIIQIPTVLAVGLTTALVPYIAEGLATRKHDMIRSNINQSLQLCIYLALPFSVMLMIMSEATYGFMFGMYSVELGSKIIYAYAFYAFMETITTVTNTLCITLRLYKQVALSLFLGILVKLSTTYLFMSILGVFGGALSSILSLCVTLILNLLFIKLLYRINYRVTILRLVETVAATAVIAVISIFIISRWDILTRMDATLQFFAMTFISISIYLVITYLMKTPQKITGKKSFLPKRKGAVE